MSAEFKITYSWVKSDQPSYFDEEEYEDLDELILYFRKFLSEYEGQFALQMGDMDLDFDLAPDLSTVFEELPSILEDLKFKEDPLAELYFFEQGTDLALVLRRIEDDICIQFRKGYSVGRRFDDLSDSIISVDAGQFFEEWRTFLDSVLDKLVEIESEIVNDTGFQDYRNKLRLVSGNS